MISYFVMGKPEILHSSQKKIIPAKIEKPSWQFVFDGLSEGSHDVSSVGPPGDSRETTDPTSTATAGACNRSIAARGQQTHSRRRDDLCLLSQEEHDGMATWIQCWERHFCLQISTKWNTSKQDTRPVPYFFFPHWCTLGGYCKIAVRISCYWNASGAEIETNIIYSDFWMYLYILQYIIIDTYILDLYK